jgi:hypothetical protein
MDPEVQNKKVISLYFGSSCSSGRNLIIPKLKLLMNGENILSFGRLYPEEFTMANMWQK